MRRRAGSIEQMAPARTLAAGRVATTRVWAEAGDRTAAHWLARTTGSTVGDAVAVLETARHLDGCEATETAFRAGEPSLAQAGAITRAAAVDPHAEGALLAAAHTNGIAELRAEARRVQAAARTDEVAREDAGEVCEIPGLGPIPVATARQLATDSILSVLVTDGVEVVGVAHTGRTVRANVRRALAERSPSCERPGCPVDHDLEIHHLTGFAVTGDTRLDDLARLCRFDHYLATHHGYRLTGPPGARRWLPPEAVDGRAPPRVA